ncbi:hypothetical protein CGCA056_v005243 [Colletotrichum aenigma]|uniref:uncharacterized protein n=1 Tax=Colletotrichum aenigma TaxID=1215731 RepID=UPI0018721D3C|nr:uncharacterized protein CGCA056_v005243 [Colletotrichum aenigma]KAF5523166.1 hypothetical protein CGCA056_v005243 [Colletotrichum aenigma]
MAVASACAHSFKMIKSDSTLIQWTCNLCHSGPHWWIFECRYCKIHTCRSNPVDTTTHFPHDGGALPSNRAWQYACN